MHSFGRVHLLQEQLQSFLQQTALDGARLTILNSCPLQTLRFDHPQVTIHNMSRWLVSFDEQGRLLEQMATAPICQYWDDDDICLPDHIETGLRLLDEDGPDAPCARVLEEWDLWGGQLTREGNLALHSVTFRLEAMRHLIYQNPPACLYDDGALTLAMVHSLWFNDRAKHHTRRHAPTYLYRPGISGPPMTFQQAVQSTTTRIADHVEPGGVVDLSPAWNQDYTALVRNFDKVTV